jgi:hypothetical protein
MGVNCSVKLNEGATWNRVGQVACILLGAKTHRKPLGRDGWHLVVEGFGYGQSKPTSDPSYVYIVVNGDASNIAAKAIASSDSMPYEIWYGLEARLLYPKATAAKIALAEGITKFFGGKIVYNDCSDKKRTFPSPLDFKGESDASFYRFQKALEELKPLTQKDVDRCAKYAAY